MHTLHKELIDAFALTLVPVVRELVQKDLSTPWNMFYVPWAAILSGFRIRVNASSILFVINAVHMWHTALFSCVLNCNVFWTKVGVR